VKEGRSCDCEDFLEGTPINDVMKVRREVREGRRNFSDSGVKKERGEKFLFTLNELERCLFTCISDCDREIVEIQEECRELAIMSNASDFCKEIEAPAFRISQLMFDINALRALFDKSIVERISESGETSSLGEGILWAIRKGFEVVIFKKQQHFIYLPPEEEGCINILGNPYDVGETEH